MISDWHGQDPEAPAVRIEELVRLVRKLWRMHEAPVDHEGRFYRLRYQADRGMWRRCASRSRSRPPGSTRG